MNPEDPQPIVLEEASAKFEASLEQCRHIVADYRSKIGGGGRKRARADPANDTASNSGGEPKA